MNIVEKSVKDNELRFIVDSNEESLFSLLKVYLEREADVDIVGQYKEHHLVDKTEFYLKTKKGKALDVFKATLTKAKKDLEGKKLK